MTEAEGNVKRYRILLFGATGYVGSGVLDECLANRRVQTVTIVTRRSVKKNSKYYRKNKKLTEIIHENLLDHSGIEPQLTGYDACLWCIGISQSQAKDEKEYTKITKDLTLAAARTLARLNPEMTFIFISGMGTNKKSGSMWARVKGETEAALGKMKFKHQYNLRPGFIKSMSGQKHSNWMYRLFIPLFPLFKVLSPSTVITNREIGKVMLHLIETTPKKRTYENKEMRALL